MAEVDPLGIRSTIELYSPPREVLALYGCWMFSVLNAPSLTRIDPVSTVKGASRSDGAPPLHR